MSSDGGEVPEASPVWRLGLALLVILGALARGYWLVTEPAHWDIDSAYYELVARRIVAGEGATLNAVWSLYGMPEQLPYAADTYWMPLPSRLLVPALLVSPQWGPAALIALVGGVTAALTAQAARDRFALAPAAAWVAGLMVASGGYLSRAM